MHPPSDQDTLALARLGRAIRAHRARRGMSRRELAATSGLSERFLADLEAGRGNIALTRFLALARALETAAPGLLGEALGQDATETRRPIVALLGVRGAGKSTLGARVAERLGLRFVEHDDLVEEAAGLALAELFPLHGEETYRRYARRVLDELFASRERTPLLLATSGGIVSDPETWPRLLETTHTVWLKADANDHWQRVLAQGDGRPMRDRPDAKADLARLLTRRAPLYAEARHVIDTSRRGLEGSLDALEAFVRDTLSRSGSDEAPGTDRGRGLTPPLRAGG